jgi:hypothetical protein
MSSDSLSKNQDQSTATRIEMIYRKSDRLTLLLVVVGILLTFSAAAALGIDSQTQSHSVERDYHAGSRMRTAQSSHIMSEQPAMMKGQEQSMKLLVAEESEESFSLGQEYADHMETNMEELKERDYKLTSPMLVYAGDMRVQVHQEKMPPFSEELAAIVKETGDGYFEDQTHRNSGTPHESSYMTIRVRSDKFYQVIEEIRKIVHSVSTLSTNSQDVTDHFVDASARADVLEAARSSLQALMAKANSVEDVLRLQKELNRLTESSESLRQRAQQLKKQSVSRKHYERIVAYAR